MSSIPQLSIGRLRGGFCVYWDDPEGKRRRYQLKANNPQEAQAEALRVYKQRTEQNQPRLDIKYIWEMYREDLGTKPTAKTMEYTGKSILPHFGSYTPDQITRPLCLEYQQKQLDQGKSIGSVWTELGHLKSALNWAVKTRMITQAPFIWKPSKPETEKTILSKESVNKLLSAAHAPHLKLALTLLLGTGARVGAILDLKWNRVSFEHNEINLRLEDSVTRKGRARVPMNSMVRQALIEHRRAALTDYVIEYAGGPVKCIRNGFTAAVRRAGLPHTRIHDLRHTAAVTMLSQGLPLEKVAQMLGHSNVSTTYRVYGRYLPEHMKDAADLLDFTK